MRKIKEVLRLRHAVGLSQDQIARSCSLAQSSVHRYLARATAAGLSWPLPADYDDRQLQNLLFPDRRRLRARSAYPAPDFAGLHQQLQTHSHLTLQLAWEEYRTQHPDGYGYSRFCELYQQWRQTQDLTLRQEHKAGEKLFVDYAGATIPIYDPQSGTCHPASLFVAVLGASSYTFVEATWGQDLACWIGSHIRALEFFGGAPQLIVPDNAKTGVQKPCRYEPDLNRTYAEWAPTTASPSCRPGPTSRATKPKSRVVCKWSSAGLWRRSAIAPSSRSTN